MKPSVFEPEPGKPAAVHAMGISPSLKLALELGPLGIFFLVNFRGQWLIDHVPLFSSFEKPIFPATAIFMVAIVAALVISWVVARRLPVMPLVSGIFVLVFGALTLWLHDATFIKMKPTIINTLFALILFGGLVFKKPLLGYALDSALNLDAEGWRKLTFRWAFFFLFLAVVNEIIWRNFSETFWLSFRFFGNMAFTIIFLGLQMPLLMRHSVEEHGKTREAVFTKPAARPENKETPTRKKPSSGQS